jgi:hypothetical protein
VCAVLAAAIRSFEGMQPTFAHVVPEKVSSIKSVLAPEWRALRSAESPAVPDPMIATSLWSDGVFKRRASVSGRAVSELSN